MNYLEVIKILKKEYPVNRIALEFKDPLQLLIATILSAQCTDERVNKVTPGLFKKYKTARDYAEAELPVLEQEIKSTGFYKNKARSIVNCCKELVKKYNGKVPDKLEELVKLPGVGRKTANVILGNAYGIPGIVVDTHVKRVSYRLGLTKNTDPEKIEFDLMKIIPKQDWTHFSNALIYHGRNVCVARKPKCNICKLEKYCQKIGL